MSSYPNRIKEVMKKKNITRLEIVAGEVEVSLSTLRMVMNGAIPSKNVEEKIVAWLKRGEK